MLFDENDLAVRWVLRPLFFSIASARVANMQRGKAALALYGNPSVVLAGLRPEGECRINAPLSGHAPIRVKSQLAAWR